MSIMKKETEAHRRFEKYREELAKAPTSADSKENRSFSEFVNNKKAGIDKSKDIFK